MRFYFPNYSFTKGKFTDGDIKSKFERYRILMNKAIEGNQLFI